MDCILNANKRKPINNEKYKIIGKSNFNYDNVSDVLICDNLSKYYGEKILKFLRDDMGDNDTYYPKLVDQNYVLYEWKP